MTKASLLTQQIEDNRARVAAVTFSLGSYVLFDTLVDAISRTSNDSRAADPASDLKTAAAQQLSATKLALCNLEQVHMLANQLGLLRLSDLRVGPETATSPAAAGRLDALRTCAPRAQVVAYHEPSDVLSMYAVDPPDAVSQGNTVINVVKPFARAIGFAADPIEAHTRHASQSVISELLVDGYCPGDCASTAAGRAGQ